MSSSNNRIVVRCERQDVTIRKNGGVAIFSNEQNVHLVNNANISSQNERVVEHISTAAATQHVVNHYFGRMPIVGVYTLGGFAAIASVYADNNQAIISFSQPFECKVVLR